jgi:hypothetical protein
MMARIGGSGAMLHETLIGQRQENFQQRSYDKCIVVHLSNDERIDIALERNIRILEKQAEKEQHKDPRTLIYLAKGYYDRGSELFVRTKDEDEAKKLREEWYSKALASV